MSPSCPLRPVLLALFFLNFIYDFSFALNDFGQDMPSHGAIVKARRREQAHQSSSKTRPVGQLWLDKVKQEVALNGEKDPAHFLWEPLRGDAPWLSLAALAASEQETKPAQGSVLLTSPNMLHFTDLILKQKKSQHQQIVLVADFTYKICIEDWGLASLGVCLKSLDRSTNLPATNFCVSALSWGPKEDCATWFGTVVTCISVIQERLGVDLSKRLDAVILDGTQGGLKAVRLALPRVALWRDLRHTLVNLKKLPRHISPAQKYNLYLAGECNWSANLASDQLFHEVWETILSTLLLANKDTLVDYCRRELLEWLPWLVLRKPLLFIRASHRFPSCRKCCIFKDSLYRNVSFMVKAY